MHNYLIPIAKVPRTKVEDERGVIGEFPGSEDYLIDAVYHTGFRDTLFRSMKEGKNIKLDGSRLMALRTVRACAKLAGQG